MTFNVIETSHDEGRPIFLYAFKLGAATFRYTSGDADVTIDGYKWRAEAISDNGVKLTGEATTDGLEITAPSSIAPVQMFLGTPPSQAIMVSIFHYHEDDNEAVLGYIGEVMQVNQPEPGKAIITCDTISASMQRDGLRLAWQRNCPYAVYDEKTCKASKAAHQINATVYDVVGNVVAFSGMDDVENGTLDGGFIEWEHPSRGTEFRAIEKQIGNTCEMFGLGDGLYYGLAVKAYPGCRRTTADCTDKFNNLDNYGGVPDLPGKSPFDGDPVF
jgi:uncharacterized phage protein (TIGR02218 family)